MLLSQYYLRIITRTLVKEGAKWGANSTIICGTEFGKHSFAAAGAVVTKNVPDYAMMVGVPENNQGGYVNAVNR